MRGLFGDRFLKRFAGDRKHWRKHPNNHPSNEDDAVVDANAAEPDVQVAEPSELPNGAEPNQPNDPDQQRQERS